jgi:hypothetical protein
VLRRRSATKYVSDVVSEMVSGANILGQMDGDCSAKMLIIMVPLVGFELTTYRLQGGCSTPELKRLWRRGNHTTGRCTSTSDRVLLHDLELRPAARWRGRRVVGWGPVFFGLAVTHDLGCVVGLREGQALAVFLRENACDGIDWY